VVFILAGLFLGGIGSIGVLLNLLNVASGNVGGVLGFACEGFMAVIGLIAIVHGIRSLSDPGKV
jgi:hypothetical protein